MHTPMYLCFYHLGTTEKIFAMKTHLYDIYVDNQNITVLGQIRNGIHCTGKDCLRYQEVENQLLVNNVIE